MKYLIAILSLIVFVGLSSCKENSKTDLSNTDVSNLNKPDKLMDKFSYMIGYTMGQNLKRDSVYDVNYTYLIAGIKKVLGNQEPLLNERDMQALMKEIQPIFEARRKSGMESKKRVADDNQKEAYDFLENNKKQAEVKVLPSGLQYKVMTKGSGLMPKENDYVKIYAKATLLNGNLIDDSFQSKKVMFLQLNPGLIKSWHQALGVMQKGSHWMLWSPPELAFGPGNEQMPPNKLVIFELELLDFQSKPYPDAPKEMQSPPPAAPAQPN